jgi:hypothetical protein
MRRARHAQTILLACAGWCALLFVTNIAVGDAKSCTGSVEDAVYEALYALYNATNGPKWAWKSESSQSGIVWNFTGVTSVSDGAARPCRDEWQGLTCAQQGADPNLCFIEEMDLTGYQLLGSLPSEIGNLGDIQQFVLQDNSLYGRVPTTVGSLTSVTDFILESNQFSGLIPSEIGLMSLCQEVQLSSNMFTGPMPSELYLGLTSILNFYAEDNFLTGSVSSLIGTM